MNASCLCGAVGDEVDGFAGPIMHCHCATCRKAQAAPFATTARAGGKSFRWLSGADELASFESTLRKLRHFCTSFGSELMDERVAQAQVIVHAATSSSDPGVQPSAHTWTSHDVPWWLAFDYPLTSFAWAVPPKAGG
ncbi:GFA family protein [Variovorax sp. LjRoot84]|uniref:GFA family protein n=1 Tax=Variovorax sp. LjRoot84 TaxID=3342340 RepID=UPI003ECDE0A8